MKRRKRDSELIKASQYLDSLWEKKEDYLLAVKELDNLKNNGSVKATIYGAEGGHSNGINRDTSNFIVLIEKHEKLVNDKKEEYLSLKTEIESIVQKLSQSSYRIIIRAIYLVNMSLEEVAYRYHHTYRTTQRIHNKALREIYKIKFSKKCRMMSYNVL